MPTPPNKLETQLSAYLDGELSERETREVERRLAQSAEARAQLESLRAISRGLAELPRHAAPMPIDAWAREPVEPAQTAPTVSPIRRRMIFVFSRVSAAAALIAIGMFAAWMLPPRHVRTAAPDEIATESVNLREARSKAVTPDVTIPSFNGGAAAETPTGYTSIAPHEENKQRSFAQAPPAAPAPATDSIAGGAAFSYGNGAKEVGRVDGTVPGAPLDVSYGARTAPVVNVVLVPGSTEQRKKLEDTVSAWNDSAFAGSGGARQADRVAGSGDAGEAHGYYSMPKGGNESNSLSFNAAPAQVWWLVESLNEQASDTDEVRIQMDFRPAQLGQVRTMLNFAAERSAYATTGVNLAKAPVMPMPAEPAPPVVQARATEPAARQLQPLGYTGANRDEEAASAAKDGDASDAVRKSDTAHKKAATRPNEGAPTADRVAADDAKRRAGAPAGQPIPSSAEIERGSRETKSDAAGRAAADHVGEKRAEASKSQYRRPVGDSASSPARPPVSPPTDAPPPSLRAAVERSRSKDEREQPQLEHPGDEPAGRFGLDELQQPAASQSSVAALVDQVRQTASTLGQRVDGVLRFALSRLEEEARRRRVPPRSGDERLGAPEAVEGAPNVRVIVTILPAPTSAASQPASQPERR